MHKPHQQAFAGPLPVSSNTLNGEFYIILNVGDPISGCGHSDTSNLITVYPLPFVDFSTTNNTICPDDIITANNSSISTSNPIYSWSSNPSNNTILQCTSEYPCDYKNVGLNVMIEMKQRYGIPFGISDHTITNYATYAAITLGASVVEKHLTFSREMYGSDAQHSLTPDEFRELVIGIRSIETILKNPVDKDKYSDSIMDMKMVFQKSIVSNIDIPKNSTLDISMISFKKPGTGIEPFLLSKVLGKRAKVNIPKDKIIKFEDLD